MKKYFSFVAFMQSIEFVKLTRLINRNWVGLNGPYDVKRAKKSEVHPISSLAFLNDDRILYRSAKSKNS